MKVFISGPYTHPDPVENTRKAILAGEEVSRCGHTPWIPHLNIQWHMVCPHNPDFWYRYDKEWLKVCDVLIRLPDESYGADEEVRLANELGIPVFSLEEFTRSFSCAATIADQNISRTKP